MPFEELNSAERYFRSNVEHGSTTAETRVSFDQLLLRLKRIEVKARTALAEKTGRSTLEMVASVFLGHENFVSPFSRKRAVFDRIAAAKEYAKQRKKPVTAAGALEHLQKIREALTRAGLSS